MHTILFVLLWPCNHNSTRNTTPPPPPRLIRWYCPTASGTILKGCRNVTIRRSLYGIDIRGLWCQKRVPATGIRNCIPQYSVGCIYFSMGLLPDAQNCWLHMRPQCQEHFPRHRLQRKPLVSDPGMHHGMWCMSGSLTAMAGKTFPAFPAHNPQIGVSGKRSMIDIPASSTKVLIYSVYSGCMCLGLLFRFFNCVWHLAERKFIGRSLLFMAWAAQIFNVRF